MTRVSILILGAAMTTGVLGLSAAPPPALPPGHPTTAPALPPGHPPLPPTPRPTADPVIAADPADVASIDAIVAAYYESISGPAGQPRNWDRFRSLLRADSSFVTTRAVGDQSAAYTLSIDQYIQANDSYFQRGGYFETELHRHVDQFGRIAQVFSTYASRRRADDPVPYSRGINAIQLLRFEGRWWIISVMWDYERPAAEPLPPQFMPQAASQPHAGS